MIAEQRDEAARKVYEKPAIKRLGTVAELSLAGTGGAGSSGTIGVS